MRGMNSWVVLVATIALAAYCHAQENAAGEVLGEADAIASKGDRSASSEEKIDAQEDYGLHVVNPGRLESYKYFEQMIEQLPSAVGERLRRMVSWRLSDRNAVLYLRHIAPLHWEEEERYGSASA